jgi:hypothetical protein
VPNRTRPCCRGRMQNFRLLAMEKSRIPGMLKKAQAQTLDLFAIATQEPCKPQASDWNDRGETMRPTPLSDHP